MCACACAFVPEAGVSGHSARLWLVWTEPVWFSIRVEEEPLQALRSRPQQPLPTAQSCRLHVLPVSGDRGQLTLVGAIGAGRKGDLCLSLWGQSVSWQAALQG